MQCVSAIASPTVRNNAIGFAIRTSVRFDKIYKLLDRFRRILNLVVIAVIADSSFIILDERKGLRKKALFASPKRSNFLAVKFQNP
jgi:hypothetical protein